ncbi:tryptophan-rich sensory protein [Candidatus Woesebacteria bacterium]|nr:tryptophan-rich sensory protein [Candidatus Woesebacteria bacterium]MCD8526939.1 tryptophan-rich sensory protein [Candidatus Woesebacteria bacterium]MCD8545838.1 tryptophan-rich sensory protein [Candidatus Woesebacteria bacterium]
MYMKDLSKLIFSVVVCELVGIIGSVFTVSAIPTWYATLNKPFFAPPNWLFGPVWTLLYFLMGVSFYLLWRQGWTKKSVRTARNYFLLQLGLNFLWTPIFFGLRSPLLALLVMSALWAAIIMAMLKIYRVSRMAAAILLPYLFWVSFAAALNAGIVVLN